jgi:GAF domain-containing protein
MASRLQIASQIRGTKTQDGELFIVTADSAGRTEDIPLARFLERVRKGFEMDIVFVSRFAGGERIIQHVAADPADPLALSAGHSDPLEESYCHYVATGRLPELIPDTRDEPLAMALAGTAKARVGSHLATALVGVNGKVFGTICCYSHHPRTDLGHQEDLEALRSIAELLGQAIEGSMPR